MANTEITSVYKGAQFGVEVTSGTGVAANKKLDSFSITIQPQGTSDIYAPVGAKTNTLVIPPGERWCTASLNGRLTYSQAPYYLSSAIKTTSASTPSGATNTRLWIFDLQKNAADAVKTFTVEVGDSGRAQKFNYGFVNELTVEMSKQQALISGSMMGRTLQDDVTITSSPTQVANTPVFPQNFKVYFADTQVGLDSATALTYPFKASFKISNRHNTLMVMDGTTSFADVVEVKPNIEMSLTLAADDAGFGPLNKLTNGSTQFIRVKNEGSTIEGSLNYLFQIDFSGAVTKYPSQAEQDGALTVEWVFADLYDISWGKSFEVRVQNALASL